MLEVLASQHLGRPETRPRRTSGLQLAVWDEGEGQQLLAALTDHATEKGIQEWKNHNEGCEEWKFCAVMHAVMAWDFVLWLLTWTL